MILCELCESEVEIIAGGSARCSSCGLKYSRERMQEMIKHSGLPIAVASSPESSLSKLEMAKLALQAGNWSEAESLCSILLQHSAPTFEVWSIKAESVGRQSREGALRLGECAFGFLRALRLCSSENSEHDRDALVKRFDSIVNDSLPVHITGLMRYRKEASLMAFERDVLDTKKAIWSEANDDEAMPFAEVIAKSILATTMHERNSLLNYYDLSSDYIHNDDVDIYVGIESASHRLLQIGLLATEGTADSDIEIHSAAIRICGAMLSKMYKLGWPGPILSDAGRDRWQAHLKRATDRMQEIKQMQQDRDHARRRARIAEHWAKHAERHTELITELDTLVTELASVQKAIHDHPSHGIQRDLKSEILMLSAEKESTSVLNAKKRRELTTHIASLELELAEESRRCEVAVIPLRDRMRQMQDRQKAIESELAAPDMT